MFCFSTTCWYSKEAGEKEHFGNAPIFSCKFIKADSKPSMIMRKSLPDVGNAFHVKDFGVI